MGGIVDDDDDDVADDVADDVGDEDEDVVDDDDVWMDGSGLWDVMFFPGLFVCCLFWFSGVIYSNTHFLSDALDSRARIPSRRGAKNNNNNNREK